MKLVRSLLTSAAFAAAMVSASFSWGQCCGGASYNTVAAAAPANGCGCNYTVMKTVKRMVNEKQDAAYSHSPASSAKLDLYYARDELKDYVSVLRVKGRNI